MNDSLYDTGIRPAFDAYLLEKAKEVRDYGPYWSASSGGYCMRKVIFDRLGVPPVETEDDARRQRVFEMGHVVHEVMQRITKEAGLSIAQEVELQDEKLMIRGHFDDLVLINKSSAFEPPDNAPIQQIPYDGESKLILYDYKSVNSQSFKYKKDKMSHYHEMQLGTYMYMLRKDYPELKESRILSISKDDWRMAEMQLLWSPALEKLIYEYWSTLNGYWKNKQLPKCTCGDYEINSKTGVGFMADPRYNPFFYEDEPCSLAWAKKTKEEGLWDYPNE